MTSDRDPSTPQRKHLALDGPLRLDALEDVYDCPITVEISPGAWDRARASRARIGRMLAAGQTIYGVNTGFGKLCNKRISDEQLDKLQTNLILSHAVGVGPPAPAAIVRWMLLFKINALLLGASGVQTDCIRFLASLLEHDLLPVVPTRGSLGASGDLAPLAHLVLPMMNRGRLVADGQIVETEGALREHGIEPVELGAKDG
ncbi:MAG TPA: aromatic amino acid ammonia-lyase, partial [Phycisphaerae bacterium]|nr:aromatic amino acid ammonia-lyase [Phycisphaerae bacterium]